MTDLKSFRYEGQKAVGELARATGKLISLLAVADAAVEMVEALEKVVEVARKTVDDVQFTIHPAILEERETQIVMKKLEEALEPLKGALAGLEVDHSDGDTP